MATLKYIVKSIKRGKFATLWARLASGREYDIFASTGYSFPPEMWSNERQGFKQRIAYTDEFTEEQARKMLNRLGDLRNTVLTALNNKAGEAINKEWLLQIIELHHDSDAIRKKQLKHQDETLNTYIDRFITESSNGTRLSIKKLQYNPSTVKNLRSFQVQFDEYQRCKRRQYNFNDITIDFYDEIVQYFTIVKGYAPNTTGRMIKHLKILMRAARDEGYHNNTEIERRKFKVITENVDNIYLNEAELKTMYELDLSDNKAHEVARDVFLIGCYTAQRFSDYSKINASNIRTLDTGEKVIDLKQQKTGAGVVLPMRTELVALLEKYDYQLPITHEQKVNSYIKKVAEKAGITEMVNMEQNRGGSLEKLTVPKFDLVKTHTARRSGATNMYLAGVPTLAIMKLTGHRTEKDFMKYIKITADENAATLYQHPYFANSKDSK